MKNSIKTKHRSTRMVAVACLALSMVVGTARTAHAVVTTRTLLPTSGNVTWEVNANWSGSDYPDTGGVNGEGALVGDVTADRTLTTTGSLTISELDIIQDSNAVNRLDLGGDLIATQAGLQSITNNTASAANLVIDLNNNTLNLNTNLAFVGPLTLLADAGGVLSGGFIRYGSASSVTGANVTLRATTGSGNILRGTFDPTTTFEFYSGAANYMFFVDSTAGTLATAIGNAVVGNGSNTTTFQMRLAGGSANFQVQNDFTILTGSNLQFFNNLVPNKLRVAGDFIDTNTTGAYITSGSATNNQIIFNGAPVSANTVDIRRSAGGVHFAVGRDAADTGNIQLANDLTTTGSFIVRDGSTLDVDAFNLAVGDFILDNNAILGFDLGGGADGVINVTGDLTLPLSATINIDDMGIVGGSIGYPLFNFGTLSGATDLSGWTINGTNGSPVALIVGNQVLLFIPEPTSIVSIAAGLLLLSCRRPRVTMKFNSEAGA